MTNKNLFADVRDGIENSLGANINWTGLEQALTQLTTIERDYVLIKRSDVPDGLGEAIECKYNWLSQKQVEQYPNRELFKAAKLIADAMEDE